MNIKVLLALALLCAVQTAGAVRVIKLIERPFELSVGDLSLPSETTGTLTFKPCDGCRAEIRRLSTSTAFLLNGGPVDFATFSAVVNDLRSKPATANHPAAVFLDIETGRVTRLSIYRR